MSTKKMGRKKKVVSFALFYEDKASKGSSEMKSDMEKVHPNGMNVDGILKGAKAVKKSRAGAGSVVVRRSTRIKSHAEASPTITNTNTLHLDPIVDLVQDQKEQEPDVQQASNPPESNGRSLEDKMDYLVGAVDFFKSKVLKQDDMDLSPDITYKSLYINSQKKIESLIEDNYELVRKLEFARGKIAAYEAMKDAQKDFVLVSGMGKAADVAASLSPKAVEKSSLSQLAASPNVPKAKKAYKKRARRV